MLCVIGRHAQATQTPTQMKFEVQHLWPWQMYVHLCIWKPGRLVITRDWIRSKRTMLMHLCQKLQSLFNQCKFLFLAVLLRNGSRINLTTNLKMKQKRHSLPSLFWFNFFFPMLLLKSSLVVLNWKSVTHLKNYRFEPWGILKGLLHIKIQTSTYCWTTTCPFQLFQLGFHGRSTHAHCWVGKRWSSG